MIAFKHMMTMAVMAVLAVALSGCVSPDKHLGDPSRFDIMPWSGPSWFKPAPGDPAIMKDMADCGFTSAGFVKVNLLKSAADTGLISLVADDRCEREKWVDFDAAKAREEFRTLVAEVKDKPLIDGFKLKDEPKVSEFAGLAEMVKIVKEEAPGKIAYINLFPTGDWGANGYDDYLERFVSTVKPQFLSYDNYLYFHPAGGERPFLANLKSVRACALRHHLPFWVINLSTEHYAYRKPTKEEFAYVANASLAYGARRLSWFTYFHPLLNGYHQAPVMADGKKTDLWEGLQKVHRSILPLGRTLEKLETVRVYHFPADNDATEAAPADAWLTAAPGCRMVVGEFKDTQSGRYLMLVNRDVKNSCTPHIATIGRGYKVIHGNDKLILPGESVLLKIKD